jgi:integral membrane protein (TIGR01906 family)
MVGRIARAGGWVAVAVATAVVLLAISIPPFLNPAWVSWEQGRAEATAWTGYSTTELRTATDAILSDLIVGPPRFDVTVGGEPVLSPAERSHMVDVRGVFVGLAVLAVVSVVVLIVEHRASRGRGAFWAAVRAGAAGLAVAVVAIGIVGAFAFDVAFEVFHRLFFAGGTYTFDPRTARLVQLFPERFWFETSMAVGVLILVLCAVTWLVAGRRRSGTARPSVVRDARLEPSR